jgi:hypothetical protein
MPQYTATIEFDSIVINTLQVKEDIKYYLRCFKNLNIKSVEKISISPEQALKEIDELIYGSSAVSSDAIRGILNKVA